MELIEKYFQNSSTLHHFYLVEGFIDETFNYLEKVLTDKFFVSKDDGSLLFQKYEKFLIDDAKKISELACRKVGQGNKQIYILGFSIFNPNAQNAILKSLEEPSVGNHFFLVVPTLNNILDTVKSRAVLIDAKKIEVDISEVKKLMKMNFAERNKWITKTHKQIEDGELSKNFVNELGRKIILELSKEKNKSFILDKIINVTKHMSRPDASAKQNLEALLYLLPKA